MKKIKIYQYTKCGTCRKALKYLEKNKLPYEMVPIVDQPPTKKELKSALDLLKGDLRKLFNTSGVVYREMKLSQKIKTMDSKKAIELLNSNGKLVKRPFVLINKRLLVGFNEEEWNEALKS